MAEYQFKICPNCGEEVPRGVIKCPRCGRLMSVLVKTWFGCTLVPVIIVLVFLVLATMCGIGTLLTR